MYSCVLSCFLQSQSLKHNILEEANLSYHQKNTSTAFPALLKQQHPEKKERIPLFQRMIHELPENKHIKINTTNMNEREF